MVAGFVLAGGRARRMGVDKARVPFPHRLPMAVWIARSVREVCGTVVLVRRRDDGLPWRDERGRDLDVVHDPPGFDAHPLRGVATALRAARGERVLVVPCDLPFLTPDDLRTLLAVDECVASDGERAQPLLAVLRAARADEVEALAAEGAPARQLAERVAVVPLRADALRNVNRWADTGRPGPVRALLEGLPWLTDSERRRVAAGEVARLRQLGAVDPEHGG